MSEATPVLDAPATVIVDERPKHARYGPSSLKNREVCAGWENDQFSDKTLAQEGTDMHYATEHEDVSQLKEQEQKDAVQKCISYVSSLLKKRKVVEDIKEVRLVILGGLTFGTADRVVIHQVANKTHADLIDYKFGRIAVDDAEDNRQGWAYVIGVFERWDVDSVKVHFLSPRRDELTSHVFYRHDIPRLALTVKLIIERAALFNETFNPKTGDCDETLLNLTESNCTFCGRKAKCPKIIGWGLTIAKKYAPLEIVDEVHSSQITDPEAMSKLFIAARVMEKLVDSVKAHVMDFARENGLPGFAISERSGATKITESVNAYPVLRKFFDEVELASCATYSYSDLQKIVSERAEKGKKTAAVRELFTALMDVDAVKINEGTQYLRRVRESASVTE